MIAWLRQHQRALAAAWGRFVRPGGLLGALVVGVALSLPAGGYALLESLRGLAGRTTLEPQLSVFLKPEMPRAEAAALGKRLQADARILSARFVPREAALDEMKADVQGLSDVVAALGRNPLPDAYVVRPKSRDPAALDLLAVDLRKLPGVERVQADAAWARRLAALLGAARLGLALLAGLLGLALVAVTFNTIRLQVLTQRAEIEVAKLIGATDAFIRRPFYYLGLVQGLAGGALALCIVAGALALLNREIADLAASYGSNFRFAFLQGREALGVVGFAAVLGWLGAYLSAARQLQRLH